MDQSSRSTGWRFRLPGRHNLLKGGLKVLLSAALFFWLLRSGNIELSAFGELAQNTQYLALAFLFLAAWFLVAAARLQVLLAACEIDIRYAHILRLFTMGEFFSLFFLGSLGGDMSRILLLGANTARKQALVPLIVLIDKATVLWVLCAVSLAALTWTPLLPAHSWSFSLHAFLACVALGWPVLLVVLHLSRSLRRREPKARLLSLLRSALEEAASVPLSAVVKNAALSFLALVLIVLNFVSCALALGVTGIAASTYLAVIPLGTLALAMPFSLGGLGTGQVAYVYLFQLCGVGGDAFAGNLSTLHIAIWSVFAMSGGILFALTRSLR